MPTSPESAVKKLSRLPSNCICPNCGTHSKYGFSSICIKYLTFVCNACKSSHQAISHRCKSLTMSSWDQGEVLKLKMHGNDYARRVWLGNGAPMVGVGGRPREGDDINVFKRFVVEVYERKRYYREPDVGAASSPSMHSDAPVNVNVHVNQHAPRHPTATVAMPKLKQAPPKQLAPRTAPVVPTPAPPPAVDLLDFGAFDNHPSLSSPAPPSQPEVASTRNIAATAAVASTSDPFFDPFINNGNPAVATSHDNSQSISNSNNHAFLAPSSGASNNASFDPFGNSSSLLSTTSNTNNNDQKVRVRVMEAPPPVMMNHAGGMMNNNNHGGGMNNNHNNMMTSGGMVNNHNSMNGGMMNNNGNNNNMMNGGMMNNSGNNNNMMNTSNNGMMMMNGGMMNTNNNMMHMMNGSMMNTNNTMSSGSQQQQPPPAMNINLMQPMNNTISNNFGVGARSSSAGVGAGAAVSLNKKPDPFAGLGF